MSLVKYERRLGLKRLKSGALLVVSLSALQLSAPVLATVPPDPKYSAPWIGKDFDGIPCKGDPQAYGPYDYTNGSHRGEPLSLVEQAHFTLAEDRLKPRRSGGIPAMLGDINYTIRAFPNHHRALYAVVRYQLQPHKISLENKVECYLQRAIGYKPQDGVLYMLTGIYNHRLERYDMALDNYLIAEKNLPESGELSYNIGLVYEAMGQRDNARDYALKAKALEYPLTGLYRKLGLAE